MKFKTATPETKSSNLPYVKLGDGESIIGVFKGEPYEFFQIWEGKKVVPEGTTGAAYRFRVNFVTKEGSTYVAKAIEQGVIFRRLMEDLNDSYPLETTVVKITRKGSSKDDTRYSILPLPPKNQPAETGWSVINKTELQKLEHVGVVKVAPEPPFDSEWPEVQDHGFSVAYDELPF